MNGIQRAIPDRASNPFWPDCPRVTQHATEKLCDRVRALLFYTCIPVSEFGPAWPEEVPVQVHGMDADPIFVGEGDIDAARELVEEAEAGELFLYPGDQHYFTDSSLPSYDPEASALLMRRVLDFLAAL